MDSFPYLKVYSDLPLDYALWTRAVGAHWVGRCVFYSYCFPWLLIRWIATGNGWNPRQPTWPNMKVLPVSKALKLYTTLTSTLTTNAFAPMFKHKLDRCIMNCDDRWRRFNETLAKGHWMSSLKNSCIHGKWLCMTCSNNKVWHLIFVKKKLRTELGCVLKRVRT